MTPKFKRTSTMARPITKADLVTDIATQGDMTKVQAAAALDAVVAAISNQLVVGNAVALPGLAKLETRERPARQVRNVATGEMMEKDADRTVKAVVLSGIKAAVNE
jgi:DNA-binding protein HU-beta